jgi:K+-transporting ATPase ATPase C chain
LTPAAGDVDRAGGRLNSFLSELARARGLREPQLRRLVEPHTTGRQFGVLGEPRVNVLELNLALDGLQ